ncbi:hypothetical protein RIR_jg3549.t1 [Rhizophagus irregularis DAOM 181602=DAOM 197198]|uniref:Uncharacterized protein n=1 Tax=Rhizophagus irregularis (strain DAOM 181602 / DAOM 197198 / MUCL 43194) TaxID=747089 RepID=U9SWD3_RHIID|nr:hypothetical protein RIR_jg3549.t1 [Rhizophagus irregularis DAOM 181602=DAOM 197198]
MAIYVEYWNSGYWDRVIRIQGIGIWNIWIQDSGFGKLYFSGKGPVREIIIIGFEERFSGGPTMNATFTVIMNYSKMFLDILGSKKYT